MKLDKYLNQLGTLSGVVVDVKKQQRMPLVERIVEILSPSYLRLEALDQVTKTMLRNKVELSVKKHQPITLILAVGGFKGIKAPRAPHINWAEVFHVDFLIKTLGEIALIYPPGLKLEFSGDDVIVPLMNNYKTDWTNTYNQEFEHLLIMVSQKLPANIVLSNRPASSFYDRFKLEEKVNREANNTNLSLERLQMKLKHAQNNYVLNGEVDLTKLSCDEIQKKLLRSMAIHDAWIAVDCVHRKDYLEGGVHVPVVHKKGMPGCYGIRSVKTSDVQFWEAEGYLEIRESKLIPRLASTSYSMEIHKSIEITTRWAELPGLRSVVLN